jgi:type VI secretion system secreted protein VgrG
MGLDIHAAVVTALVLSITGGVISFFLGLRSIRSGARLPFFRKRRDRMVAGWRMVTTSLVLGAVAFGLNRYAEPVVYHFFPPTATITLTPTDTETPTISVTPTITLTPTITNTPSITDTPGLPQEIVTAITSVVTPDPLAIFSPLAFAQKINDKNQPVNPSATFANPVGHLYGTFSFDKMKTGSQWSAIWLRDGTMVYHESYPWNGGSGGYGYTDWNPSSADWQPGNYEVQIFLGTQWMQSGRFTVTGLAPSPTITTSPTLTVTPTRTLLPTGTITPTRTQRSTQTITTTQTPLVTQTVTPTLTVTITPTQ